MSTDNTYQINTNELSNFFELLAKFDFEDKKKELSDIKTGSLVSAPKEPVLASEITNISYGAETKNI